MELRQELMPPRIKRGQIRKLARLGELIVDQLDRGTNPREMIEEFNRLTGEKLGPTDFLAAAGSNGVKDLVERLLTVPAGGRLSISDEEFLEIIRRLKEDDLPSAHETFWYELLHQNLPHPNIESLFRSGRTAEEILAEARAYKPIQL